MHHFIFKTLQLTRNPVIQKWLGYFTWILEKICLFGIPIVFTPAVIPAIIPVTLSRCLVSESCRRNKKPGFGVRTVYECLLWYNVHIINFPSNMRMGKCTERMAQVGSVTTWVLRAEEEKIANWIEEYIYILINCWRKGLIGIIRKYFLLEQ